MTTFVPVEHQVYNAFDDHGLALGLKRLPGEKNAAYRSRLFDIMVHRAGPHYLGLLNGMTREFGLSFSEVINVWCVTDEEGSFLLPEPAILFEGSLCRLMSSIDPQDEEIYLEIDRMDRSSDSWFIGGLVDAINATPYFRAELLDESFRWKRSMTIFDQSSVIVVPSEALSVGGSSVKLAHENLIEGTVAVRSSNLVERVSGEEWVNRPGRYWIDTLKGSIVCFESPAADTLVSYMYHEEPRTISSSPIILHNMQVGSFREKLFERVFDDLGEEYDGYPTLLGIDIINELYSVTPSYWGR